MTRTSDGRGRVGPQPPVHALLVALALLLPPGAGQAQEIVLVSNIGHRVQPRPLTPVVNVRRGSRPVRNATGGPRGSSAGFAEGTIPFTAPANTVLAPARTYTARPKTVTARAVAPMRVTLEWDRALPSPSTIDSDDGYKIQWSPDGSTSWTLVNYTNQHRTFDIRCTCYPTRYHDDTIEPGTTRYYRIKAVDDDDESAWSDVVSATTPGLVDSDGELILVGAVESELDALNDQKVFRVDRRLGRARRGSRGRRRDGSASGAAAAWPSTTRSVGEVTSVRPVTPRAPSGGICARTDAVRDALVARIESARDCTQVTAAHLARLTGELRLDDKGIGSLKAGDFAGLSKLEILELGGNQLDTLRSDVFNGLTALWFLDLSNNRLTSLSPGAFNGLPALEQLVLGANPLSTVPAEVFDGLPALWFLDLEGLQLSALPAEVFDGLSALEELNLEANRLSALPAGVFDGLSSLTELTLMANQLTSLPEDVFGGLSSLTTLRLDQNRLNSLPADVFNGLSSLTELTLMANQLTSLPEDVFNGLSSLYWISLPSNQLTTLPDGVFEGLSALGILEVQDNPVDPMILSASLERVGSNGFKATIPAGAPFTMTLPVSVTNGSIDGGATTLRIPVGAVESGAVTVTRAAGTTAAVTADIGTSLPPLPPRHLGYTLARASGLPLDVLPELPPALSVADARATEGVDSALVFVVTLDRSASGEVTTSYATSDGTATAGEDYEAASGTLSFAAGETERRVEVVVLDDAHDEGEETLAFALSGAAGAAIADGEATGTVAPAPGICARTEAVRDAIVARIESARDCTQVTAAHLARLTGELRLDDKGIGSLKAGDFAGLSKLETLELGGNQLDTLRSDVFNGLTALWFLDLSNNRLTSLPAGAFNGLPALEQLVLGANPLSTLPAEVFDGLPALWFLDLEGLQLSALPAEVFDGLSALEELNLEANRLSALPAGVFDGLSSLTELTLMANQLTSLPEDVFGGLSSLTTLRLDQNRLSSLPADVFNGLSSLEQLFLHTNRLTSAGLPPDVFDGLSSLWRLLLRSNQLTTLPDRVFEGLSALTILELYGNAVDPMLVIVSLEEVGSNGFKATIPAGAPFTMTLPVSVTNGSIDGGATTLRIPVGAVESGTVTVTRAAGTTAAVTANIGTSLPAPPTDHLGYTLAKASGLPLKVLPELVSAPRIVGVPQVGNVLEASFAEPPSGALAYRWLRGSEVIAGATASAYVPMAADVGARLSVRVERGGDSITSAATAPVWPAPANPPLEDGEEELLSATMTLGWYQFPLWVAGYGRVRGESFGEMDVTSFEDGGATYTIDALFVNSRGVFGLATGSTQPDASGLVAYWNGYRISGLAAYTGNSGKSPPMLMGRTPQPSTEYSRYEGGASDGIRVAVSLRRAGPPDESPAVSVSDASATEGDAIEFTVSLSAASGRQVTVEYATSNGTAESGTDYTAASGTLTFAAGETSKTVSVATTDDSADEEDETFTLTLSNPADATLGDATATGTIVDNDDALTPLTAEFRDMPETHDGESAFTFRAAFSEPLSMMNGRRLREDVVAVSGGRATSAGRVDRRRDLWELTVEPDSRADVTVTVAAGAACGTPAAVCTRDGRALSETISATVEGPVDTAATVPRITAVQVTSVPKLERDTYGRGETIRFTVSFSEQVEVTGRPHFTFSLGNRGATRRVDAPYESGSGTAALVFGYVVQEGDEDNNGIFLVDGDALGRAGPVALDAGEAITALGGGVDADLSSSVRGTQPDHKVDGSRAPAASAPMREGLAARACSALAGGDGLAPGRAAAALWRDGDMDSDQLAALDGMGNGNGTYDLGDLLAWINRCRPGSGSADGAGPPPSAPPAMPASQPARGASQRRKGARGPARRRRKAPETPAAGSRTRRSGWLRTTLLGALISAWGCGDGIVGPRADTPRHDAVGAAFADPGPLHVRLTAPAGARDIGAMLVIEGPAIDSVQAPGLEIFETDESSSTRREVVIAGALPPDAPVLRVWVPHRGDEARYRVSLLQVAAEDFTLGDPEDYAVAIGR